jgi:hypothetical protein
MAYAHLELVCASNWGLGFGPQGRSSDAMVCTISKTRPGKPRNSDRRQSIAHTADAAQVWQTLIC